MAGPGGWDREVASLAFLRDERLILIDPLVTDWSDLDDLIAGRPVTVALTAPWHQRSSAEVARRYDAQVLVHEAGQARCPLAHGVPAGEVSAGVVLISVAGVDEGEVAVWLPSEKALVTAEVLTGTDMGLRVAGSPAVSSRSELDVWIEELASLPIESVLPAHGPPVLRDGAAEILAALSRPRW